MPKIADVVRQLADVLPRYTDNFNSKFNISAITSLGSHAFQIDTALPHGLKTSDYARIYGVGVRNPITAISAAGGKITFTTQYDHDLTEWRKEGEIPNVNLTGFTGLPDGDYPLIEVPEKNKFVIESGATITVNGRLNEQRIDGVNGNYTVTVITATRFTITAPNCAFTVFNVIADVSVVTTAPRITGIAAAERIEKMYSEQKNISDFWIFATNQDSKISHDVEIPSDANQKKARVDQMFFEGNQPFDVFVVAPARDSYGGRMISDEMFEIRRALCKSLVGAEFSSGFVDDIRFLTTFLGDGFFAYVGAYYVHRFTFETVFMFSPEDGLDPADTRAFRRFEVNVKLPFDDFAEVKKIIEGDLP